MKSRKYKNNSTINNTYSNIYIFNNNVNNIISNLKNQYKKTELSTDFSSNIINKNNNINTNNSYDFKNKNFNIPFDISNTIKQRKNLNYIQLLRSKSYKFSAKNLENMHFSLLLKNQETMLLKKGKKRVAKSSLQIPFIFKKNNSCKKYKYKGLYNANVNKDNKLKKEINDLMIINQRLKFKKNKSLSFKNINLNKLNNINDEENKEKTINVKFKFTFQRKKDEFLGKNRLLMKQNYFNSLLMEKITKIENKNKKDEKKIMTLDDKIILLKECISFFKIYNIINQDLKILNIVIEKNEYNNKKLVFVIKNYKNEIDKLQMKIKIHNNKRNAIIFWYEFLCKIKKDVPIAKINNNYEEIVKGLDIDDLNKGFNQLAERIIFLGNKYKNITDEIFFLNKRKEEINKDYELMYDTDQNEIINKMKELNILKEKYYQLNNIKINIINRKVIDFLDIKKYNIEKYNPYIKKENKNIILVQKIGKLFENYIYYLKNNKYFSIKEKQKIDKIEKEIAIKKNKYRVLKKDKIKNYIFDIFSIIEKFINMILFDINQEREKIGKEEYKKILQNTRLVENVEKKLLIVYDKEDKNEEEKNISQNNKIYFLPIKKVYIPFLAIKKENAQNNLNTEYNRSFSNDNKNKNSLNEEENKNKNKKTTKSLYYMDDEGIDKYNELFFE